MIVENQILKHKHVERYIKIITVNTFKHNETGKEEIFCSYYWCGFDLIGTDLLENIERDYEFYKDI
jgi:hypothetical protein